MYQKKVYESLEEATAINGYERTPSEEGALYLEWRIKSTTFILDHRCGHRQTTYHILLLRTCHSKAKAWPHDRHRYEELHGTALSR